MKEIVFPTKGNYLKVKANLKLAKKGYELLDKKRLILASELLPMMQKALSLRAEVDVLFKSAYRNLMFASIKNGTNEIERITHSVSIKKEFEVNYKSIFGTVIPSDYVKTNEKSHHLASYGIFRTDDSTDRSFKSFFLLYDKLMDLAVLENAMVMLALSLKKNQKRTNALKYITIPKYESTLKRVSNSLEEKDREEFCRSKNIKSRKSK